MGKQIVIIDYGMGNLLSVRKKLLKFGVVPIISNNHSEIENSEKIILPGVGHFKRAMENLKHLNLIGLLNRMVLTEKKPVLGICLGMQLMAQKSEEGNVPGLGWIDAEVIRFRVSDTKKFKVPHTGWNQISVIKDSPLTIGINSNLDFYFIHSFHLLCQIPDDIIGETDYFYSFPSVISKHNIFGVQFHPEKSHEAGEILLSNFVNL